MGWEAGQAGREALGTGRKRRQCKGERQKPQGREAGQRINCSPGEVSLRKTGSPISISLSGTQFPMHWEELERRG